jgi:diadenosine tetraphosphate (Ap4A) HIT family hydrolase
MTMHERDVSVGSAFGEPARHQSPCDVCERIAQCRAGTHPGLIAELDTGYAVLGDSQQFRGYSVLLCKAPATELHELDPSTRMRFLEEMSQLAAAVGRSVGAFKLNYECLGNQVHHLHFHVFPRHKSEVGRTQPVWGQMHAEGSPEALACRFDAARDGALRERIRAELRAELRAGLRAEHGAGSQD